MIHANEREWHASIVFHIWTNNRNNCFSILLNGVTSFAFRNVHKTSNHIYLFRKNSIRWHVRASQCTQYATHFHRMQSKLERIHTVTYVQYIFLANRCVWIWISTYREHSIFWQYFNHSHIWLLIIRAVSVKFDASGPISTEITFFKWSALLRYQYSDKNDKQKE